MLNRDGFGWSDEDTKSWKDGYYGGNESESDDDD